MFTLFFYLAFSSVSNALFASIPVIQEMHPFAQKNYLLDPDFAVLSILYDSSSKASSTLSATLQILVPQLAHYLKFLSFDCLSDPEICPLSLLPDLPSLTLFIPQGLNPYTGRPQIDQRSFKGLSTAKAIGDYLTFSIPYLGEIIDSDYLKHFLSLKGPKVLLFSNKTTIPLLFKGIASRYRGRIECGVVFMNVSNAIQTYRIETFPSLVVVKENGEIVRFRGRFEYLEVEKFLEPFEGKRKPERLHKKPKSQSRILQSRLPEYQSTPIAADQFERLVRNSTRAVIVLFFKDQASEEWPDIVQRYGGMAETATVACGKQENFCKSIGAIKIPSLRLYIKSSFKEIHSIEDLELELSKDLKPKIESLKESDIRKLINSLHFSQKLLCIYISDSTLSLSYKSLSTDTSLGFFTKFIEIQTTKAQISNFFSLNAFPTILSIIKVNPNDPLQVIEYRGDINDFKGLYYFIDQLTLPEFLSHRLIVSGQPLDEVVCLRDLTIKCARKNKGCILGLLDFGSESSAKHLKILEYLKAVAFIRQLPVEILVADAGCQEELTASLGVTKEDLPKAIAFKTDLRSADIADEFEENELMGLLELVVRDRQQSKDLQKISWDEADCQKSGLNQRSTQFKPNEVKEL